MTTRNAAVQQWQAYLTSRGARQRDGRFLIHGREALTRAVGGAWPLDMLLYRLGAPDLPPWARDLLDTGGVPSMGLVPERMGELTESSAGIPDLVAVARSEAAELDRFAPGEPGAAPIVVVIERPESAIRLGGVIRAAHAFGAAAVVISGPAADQYDPRCVQASAGALFELPVFRTSGAAPICAWRDRQAARGIPTAVVGVISARERYAPRPLDECDFTGAAIVVIGDEAPGAGRTWREVCDELVVLPAHGMLAAPCAAAVVLYEIARQRRVLIG